jgi:hypothetical protein
MNNNIINWPSISELDTKNSISLPPYGVISQYSDAIFKFYDEKLIGIVMARYKVAPNGDKSDFTYSLTICKTAVDGAQIKIIEVDIENNGWYPAKVFLIKPYREPFGVAENEEQLRKILDAAINSDFTKIQIKALLL